ncbi:DUF7713 domain-containing protein [Pseudomonas sichuanensis]|uniref:DUF7713 domain-containing protein n=1 Tax=Pseudomonas sichuanensis TaxID=2213015 RepID=UPI001300282E|nr:hypothetical protein [Pseudomonas sichuanensis]
MTKDIQWEEFIAQHCKPLEIADFTGAVRTFNLSGYKTICYTITAKESENPDGNYEFSSFSYTSPHEAFIKLVEKIRAALATRNLNPNNFPHLLTNKCEGRVANGGVVIDGKFISWARFTEIMQSHEGWEFALRFGDT